MSQNLDQILTDAVAKNLSLSAALESLADRELEARNGRAVERRFRFSRLGARSPIDSFQFSHHKSRTQLKNAIGAPSKPLFAALLLVVYGLMVAFGVGIWKAAGGNRRLRVAGGLLIGLGVMALTVGQFASMRLRGTAQGLASTMHLVEGMVAMLMIFTAMGIAATAFGTRFRLYTIATIVLAVGFGAWAGLEAPRIEQGLATPWVGVKERIFWYGYQSWFIVLALRLLRQPVGAPWGRQVVRENKR